MGSRLIGQDDSRNHLRVQDGKPGENGVDQPIGFDVGAPLDGKLAVPPGRSGPGAPGDRRRGRVHRLPPPGSAHAFLPPSTSPRGGAGATGGADNNLLSKGESTFDPVPYTPWKTLLPRFWLPTLLWDHKGAVAGAFTAGQDVVGYNTYRIQVDHGLISNSTYYDFEYLNDYFYPTF